MTRPENDESTEAQVRQEKLEVAVEDPAVSVPAASTPAASTPAQKDAAQKDPAQTTPSSNGADSSTSPPRQRQRTAKGDEDQKTVTLQVGAPEHAHSAGREHANRQPLGGRAYGFSPGLGPPVAEDATRHVPPASMGGQDNRGAAPDFSPSTVRIGGYTPPERVSPPPSTSARVRPARVPRRTSLQLQRLEPWSVLKLSLVLSIAGFLAWMVAVGVLYGVLAGMGVWDQINGTYSDFASGNNPQEGTELISGGRVFGVAFVVGLVNIVLMTALATVGSLIYNVATDLVGGIEVTLSEPD